MARVCVGDLEGDGLLNEVTRIWCGVFKDVRTGQVWKFGPNKIPQMLKFMDSIDVLAMHNGIGYDWPALRKLYDYEYPGKKIDTLLMSRAQRPDRQAPMGCKAGPHSVEAWGIRFGRHKPEHEDWSQFTQDMLHRCTEDVEIQHQVLDYLIEEGSGYSWNNAHLLYRDLFGILQLQESYGWLLDTDHVQRHVSLLTHWMDRIDRIVTPTLPYLITRPDKVDGEYKYYKNPFTKGGKYQHYILKWMEDTGLDPDERPICGPFSRVEFNKVDLGSNDQVKTYLLEQGWQPIKWNTSKKTGERTSPKMDQDDPFDGVDGFTGKLIAKRVVIRHRRSQMEGWLRDVDADGRLRQGITGIASTGRLKHTRIVNVPNAESFFGRAMRRSFIAKPGYKIVGVDADSCQLRMLAGRMGDPEYQDAIINGDKSKGTDIHSVNMRMAELDTRANAKTFIYGFLFGAGDAKVGTIVKGTSKDGRRLKETFLEKLPKLADLIDSLTSEWRSNAKRRRGKWGMEYYNGWFTGVDGRPVYCSSEHMVLVYCLQNDEAVLMQTALVLLFQWLTNRGWVHGREYGFVANVHDEIQAEVREDLVHEYAQAAEEAIAEAGVILGFHCPHVGGADIGNNWYETH